MREESKPATISDDDGSEKSAPKLKEIDESYKNDNYWSLPPNVRNAIDLAKQKSTHTEFFHQLE